MATTLKPVTCLMYVAYLIVHDSEPTVCNSLMDETSRSELHHNVFKSKEKQTGDLVCNLCLNPLTANKANKRNLTV